MRGLLSAAGWTVVANKTNGVGETWVLDRCCPKTYTISYTFTTGVATNLIAAVAGV